jgi:hypothetical protein
MKINDVSQDQSWGLWIQEVEAFPLYVNETGGTDPLVNFYSRLNQESKYRITRNRDSDIGSLGFRSVPDFTRTLVINVYDRQFHTLAFHDCLNSPWHLPFQLQDVTPIDP